MANRTLTMSSILRTGEIAGLRTGDSSEAIIAALGEPQWSGEGMKGVTHGFGYGDLQVWFGYDEGLGRSELIYLNGHRPNSPVRVRSRLPFRSEGLRWGMEPGEFCRWAIDHQVSFVYRSDSKSEALTDAIQIVLTDVVERTGAIFCVFDDGSKELCEIYFSLPRK